MDLPKDTFSFRDYIAFMFPGLVVVAAACLTQPQATEWLERHNLIAATVLFAGSYILGSICQTVSYGLLLHLMHRLICNPNHILSEDCGKYLYNADAAFSKKVKVLLREYWGVDSAEGLTETTVLYLCWRVVQEKGHPSFEYMKRCVSLSNYYATMLSADLILAVCLAVTRHFGWMVLSIVLLPLLTRSYYNYRGQFVMNVYRLFYTRNSAVPLSDACRPGERQNQC